MQKSMRASYAARTPRVRRAYVARMPHVCDLHCFFKDAEHTCEVRRTYAARTLHVRRILFKFGFFA